MTNKQRITLDASQLRSSLLRSRYRFSRSTFAALQAGSYIYLNWSVGNLTWYLPIIVFALSYAFADAFIRLATLVISTFRIYK